MYKRQPLEADDWAEELWDLWKLSKAYGALTRPSKQVLMLLEKEEAKVEIQPEQPLVDSASAVANEETEVNPDLVALFESDTDLEELIALFEDDTPIEELIANA